MIVSVAQAEYPHLTAASLFAKFGVQPRIHGGWEEPPPIDGSKDDMNKKEHVAVCANHVRCRHGRRPGCVRGGLAETLALDVRQIRHDIGADS